MRSLLVAPPEVHGISVVLSANRVAADVLRRLLLEVEEYWTISFLLRRSRRNISQLLTILWLSTWMSISEERICIGIQLELLGQFLLRHVKSLVMKTSLICTSS